MRIVFSRLIDGIGPERRPHRKVHGPSPVGRWAAFVARPLVGLAVAGCAASQPAGPIDQILTGVTVVSLDSATGAAPTALALGGGRVVGLGNDDSVSRWRASGAPVTDLGGAVIGPAFVDHHVHLYNVGLALLNHAEADRLFLDLSGATTVAAVERLVADRAARTPAGGWILGAGWSQGAWGSAALPTSDPLDRAAPQHPVFLGRTDGHAGWVNRRALELAGVTPDASDPPGGRFERGGDGRPSGVLLERANEPVMALIPVPSDEDVMTAFRMAADSLAARGVVEVYDAGFLAAPGVVALEADLGRLLQLLRRADSIAPLPIQVNLMIPAPTRLADSILAAGPAGREVSPRIRISHLKLFGDGALGSRGAALTHPYADDAATRGVPRMTTAEIETWTRRGLAAGLGVATHAIGDEAVDRALDAYEAILAADPGLDRHRLRIEHFSSARDEDFGRAVRLGVVLSIQSNFNGLPGDTASLGHLRIGPEGESRVYAWNRLHDLGAELAEGSDYFTRPAGPLAGLIATLTRRHAVGEHRADPAARILAWRLNARRFPPSGPAVDPIIRPGSAADLVVLSADPRAGTREALGEIRVIATVRAGRFSFGPVR